MTTSINRITSFFVLALFVTFAAASPTAKVSAVKVEDIPAPELVNKLAVHHEVAAAPDNNADLDFSEDGEDFDMDVDSRELDTNEMNNEDDVDLDIDVHQLDTNEADDHAEEVSPVAVDAEIESSERTVLRPPYKYGYGYPYGGRFGSRFGRFGRFGYFGRFGRGRFGRFGRFGRGRFGRFGRFGPRYGRGYPYGPGYYGAKYRY